MKLIKIYCALFALSVLALQPVWSASKYLVPILPFILIFLAREVVMAKRKTLGPIKPLHGKCVRVQIPLTILLAFLLANAVWLGTRAVKQVGDNIQYIRGNRYAGYPPEARKMFEAFERARDLPADVRIVCRKPEILFIVSGRQSVYPWNVEEE